MKKNQLINSNFFQDSLEIGFPTQNLSIEIFCFDCSKDNIEEVLSRWMPHIDKVEQMNIGNVRSVEQHRKCLKIFRTYVSFIFYWYIY